MYLVWRTKTKLRCALGTNLLVVYSVDVEYRERFIYNLRGNEVRRQFFFFFSISPYGRWWGRGGPANTVLPSSSPRKLVLSTQPDTRGRTSPCAVFESTTFVNGIGYVASRPPTRAVLTLAFGAETVRRSMYVCICMYVCMYVQGLTSCEKV